MKVLQINSVCGIGSTGRIATDIHGVLVNDGHESYVGYGRGSARNCDTAIRIGSKTDLYCHVALTRLFDKHGFGSRQATRAFVEQVRVLDPDIIHLHNLHGYYINVELLFQYLKTTSKPVVWTLHDCWPFTGHCAHFDYVGCDRWKDGCHSCPQKATYPSSILVDASRQNYNKKRGLFAGVKNLAIVTPSQWLARLVEQSFLRDYPVRVINNGIDLSKFRIVDSVSFRQRYGLQEKFIILGVANVWSARKGMQYFVELSTRISEDDVIVLVGLSQRQKKSLPKNIIGVARTHNVDELVEIYNAADVFVNPTLEEVMATTNVESLACGTPVVTFDTGGNIECIDPGTGFVVPKGDVDGLVGAIMQVKQRGKSDLVKAATGRARTHYAKERMCRDYLCMYNRLLLV